MNILFIDDNSTIQKVNILMLRKFQYLKDEDKIFFRKSTKLLESDLNELLKICQVIICDYHLGINEPNGLEFFENIKDRFFGLKILLTSNDTDVLKNIMASREDIKYIIKAKTFMGQQLNTKELGNYVYEYKKIKG